MKKVGILTINDMKNVGNRLQNYATQEVLKNLGCEAETIHNSEKMYNGNYYRIIRKKLANIYKIVFGRKKYIRHYYFMQFEKNIRHSKYMIDYKHIPKELNNEYDYFVAGSDQIWNPTWGRMSDIDFLSFADYNKRISFAASMGIGYIPKDFENFYKEKVKELKNVSVREDKAKELLENLTDRKDIEVLIDPTMLLKTEEWDKVAKRPKFLDKMTHKNIIATYFLGKLSEERKKEINRIAEENDCDIINMLETKIGPSEFLYLEKNAFLICTDSFHSSVFAILYNRPFLVFNREDKEESMNSRLETLLNKFKLDDRKYTGEITKKQLECNYEESYKILEEEREKSYNFLKKSLEIK